MAETLDDALNRRCADGSISVHDAEEVRNFADFLAASGPAPSSPDFDRVQFSQAYKDHYPEDYARDIERYKADHA